MKGHKTLKLTALLFGIFLFLFASITFISKHKFAPGQGLADSVQNEAIVQFVVQPSSVGVNVRPEMPADRIPYGNPVVRALLVKNLSAEEKTVFLNVAVDPADLQDSVHWSAPWPMHLTLAANEEKKLPLAFLLERAKFKSRDGVLIFRISY